jgi:hypothetical protein
MKAKSTRINKIVQDSNQQNVQSIVSDLLDHLYE